MYKNLKWCCGLTAALTAVGCVAWIGGGGQLPRAASAAVVITITVATLLSAGIWAVEQAVRQGVEEALEEATVQWQVVTVANLRSVLETEVREMVDAGLSRAQRYGMVMEAAGRVDPPTNGTVTNLYERS